MTRTAGRYCDSPPTGFRRPRRSRIGCGRWRLTRTRSCAHGCRMCCRCSASSKRCVRREPPTVDQQQRITDITNQVRDRLGITVGSLTLGPITGGLDAGGALTATVHGIDAQDIVGDGYSVRRVTADLSVGVAGVGQLATDYPTRRPRTPPGRGRRRSALTWDSTPPSSTPRPRPARWSSERRSTSAAMSG